MTIENKVKVKSSGSIIYASKTEIGKFYVTAKHGTVVKCLRFTNDKRVVLESLETGNENIVSQIYLLKEVNQEEVKKEMAKKEVNGKNEKVKEVKKSKRGIEWEKISHLFASGESLKVGDVLEKVKVEATYCSPISRVYSTLRNMIRAGVLKRGTEKATFQLVDSNKKYEEKKEEVKHVKKTAPKKEPAKAKVKSTPKKKEKKTEPEAPKTEQPADVSTL